MKDNEEEEVLLFADFSFWLLSMYFCVAGSYHCKSRFDSLSGLQMLEWNGNNDISFLIAKHKKILWWALVSCIKHVHGAQQTQVMGHVRDPLNMWNSSRNPGMNIS